MKPCLWVLSGQSGISRVSEALQAHIWPLDPRSSKPRTQAARVSEDSDDEDEDTDGPISQHRSRRDSTTSSTSDGFDDNFAPFVSAAARDTVLSAAPTSPSLDDTSLPTFPSSSDYPPMDDNTGEEDPASHLADMFASFAGLREKAMNMQDRNQKMDFAEEIALKFAKQLDLLMGDELEAIPDVQLPDINSQRAAEAKYEEDSVDGSQSTNAASSTEASRSTQTIRSE